MSSFEQCFLCKSGFSRAKDKYLIQERSKENLPFELNSLPFSLTFNSTDYLCRSCVNTLKKRRSLIEQLKQIEARFKSFHQSTKVTLPSTGLKRSLQDEDVLKAQGDEQVSEVAINVLQSTPVKSSSSKCYKHIRWLLNERLDSLYLFSKQAYLKLLFDSGKC